jgi:hypothetical protein
MSQRHDLYRRVRVVRTTPPSAIAGAPPFLAFPRSPTGPFAVVFGPPSQIAGAATPACFPQDYVVRRQFMSAPAIILCAAARTTARARGPSDAPAGIVFPLSDRLKVGWVAARTNPAQMVNGQSCGDRSDERLVCYAVRQPVLASGGSSGTIARAIYALLPYPARRGVASILNADARENVIANILCVVGALGLRHLPRPPCFTGRRHHISKWQRESLIDRLPHPHKSECGISKTSSGGRGDDDGPAAHGSAVPNMTGDERYAARRPNARQGAAGWGLGDGARCDMFPREHGSTPPCAR